MAAEAGAQQESLQSRSLVPVPWILGAVAFAMFIALVAGWFFLMTQDITVVLLGGLAAMIPLYLLVSYWVWRDANEQNMMAALWVVVTVFLFVFGLALYLVVRELRAAIRDR